MKVVLLAAGRGRRMGALTRYQPKPAIELAPGVSLLWHQWQCFYRAGFRTFYSNVSYLGEVLQARFPSLPAEVSWQWYHEGDVPRETAGALALMWEVLEEEPFVVSSSDVVTAFPMQTLTSPPEGFLAQAVCVPTPVGQSPDFLWHEGELHPVRSGAPGLPVTYGNISVIRPEVLAPALASGAQGVGLGHCFRAGLAAGKPIQGVYYEGPWFNVGTVATLQKARAWYRQAY